ncbi:MAG: GNAT family N-acetyltransferase [Rhodanobacteraceae bacterium]
MSSALPLTTALLDAAGLPDDLAVRPEIDADRSFLAALYASTRKRELEAANHWSDAQRQQFLAMQFDAQHAHYREHFGDAEFAIIERAGVPIGRLYLQRREDEIRLIDIALNADQRGDGLGTAMLEALLGLAEQAGLAVRLHVEHFNPALRLYQRLGFKLVEDRGVYCFMAWQPPAVGRHEPPQAKTAS